MTINYPLSAPSINTAGSATTLVANNKGVSATQREVRVLLPVVAR
jgi:hypothetical protein